MSALDITPQSSRVPSLAVRARDVLISAWTKVLLVRSTYWILLIAAVTASLGADDGIRTRHRHLGKELESMSSSVPPSGAVGSVRLFVRDVLPNPPRSNTRYSG